MPELSLLRRELLCIFRTRRAFWLLVLTVVVTTLLPLSFWPVRHSRGAQIPTSSFYLLFFWTLLTAGLIAACSFAAGSIAGEREQGTYELLCSLPLSPLAALLPKLTAYTVYVSILLLSTAPAGMSFYFLGGIGLDTILEVYGVLLAAVVSAVPIYVAASLQSATTAEAAMRGMSWIAFWCSGPFLPFLVLIPAVQQVRSIRQFGLAVELTPAGIVNVVLRRIWAIPAATLLIVELFRNNLAPWIGDARAASPFLVAQSLIDGNAIENDSAARYWAFALVIGTAHFAYTALSLRGGSVFLGYDPNPWRLTTRPGEWASCSSRERSLLTETLIDWGRGGVRALENPVFLREVGSEFHGGRTFRQRVFFGLLLACLLLTIPLANGLRQEWLTTLFVSLTAISILVIPAIAGVAISSEVERGSLEALLATPLSRGEILKGKLLACLASVSGVPAVGAWLLSFALLLLLGMKDDPTPLAVMAGRVGLGSLVFAVTAVYAGVASLHASVCAGRSMIALLVAYLLALGSTALLPGYLAMILPAAAVPQWLSPFSAEAACLTGGPFEVRWQTATIYCGLHGLAALVLWRLAVRRLECR